MTAVSRPIPSRLEPLELHTGDRMTQKEFHAAYERTPEGFKAELIGGIVYVASPLKLRHGNPHLHFGSIFAVYEGATPRVEASDNTTVILGELAEPQPDLFLRILPEHGGQSKTTSDDYVEGAPELVAEVAVSSRSIDLHLKRKDYADYGVLEYMVLCVRERQFRWFDLRANQELSLDSDNICRAKTFPGLWIDSDALFARDYARAMTILQQGITTPQHAEFITRLAAAKGAS